MRLLHRPWVCRKNLRNIEVQGLSEKKIDLFSSMGLFMVISDQVWAFPFSSFEVNIIYK